MIQGKRIRALGRQLIKDNPPLIGTTFVYFGMLMVINYIPQILSYSIGGGIFTALVWPIGSIFISIPLYLGLIHIYNMVYYGKRCDFKNFFDFFKRYGVSIRVIGYQAILLAAMIVLSFIIIIPLSIMLVVNSMSGSYSLFFDHSPELVVFPIIFFVFFLAVGIVFSCLCLTCCFIALRNRSITFGRLISSSFKISFRYLFKFVAFFLPFVGWFILALLPAIFVGIFFIYVEYLNGTLIWSDPYGMNVFGSGMNFISFVIYLVTMLFTALPYTYFYASSVIFFNTAIDEYEKEINENSLPFRPLHRTADIMDDSETAAPAVSQEPPEPVEHIEAEQVVGAEELCDVVLIDAGIASMMVTHIVAEAAQLDLSEARELVSGVSGGPKTVKAGVSREQANEIAKLLTDAGAKVEIQ